MILVLRDMRATADATHPSSLTFLYFIATPITVFTHPSYLPLIITAYMIPMYDIDIVILHLKLAGAMTASEP
jgi:hypothetical protein